MSFGIASADSVACAASASTHAATYRYAEGTKLFACAQARKGVLEAVVIKSVRLVSNAATHGQLLALYLDTFNRLWNERDLCIEEDARALAIAFLEDRRKKLLGALRACP